MSQRLQVRFLVPLRSKFIDMLIYPLTADVPEVAVLIGFILLFNRRPSNKKGELTLGSVSHELQATGNENSMKKEGAGV